MPRLKLSDDEFDPDALDVEYNKDGYDDYAGEIPPTGTMLLGRVKKLWWTYSGNEDPMIKALFIAEDNEDGLEEYDGLPVWDNLTFIPAAAFKYMPFLDALGLTLQQIKTKLYIADDEDNLGTPIERIGDWKPNSDDAWAMVTIKKDRYNGVWQAKASTYIAADEGEEEEEAPPPKASRKAPASRTKTRSRREPEPEEDEPEDDEEEPDEEEERPRATRRGRAATKTRPAPAKTRTRRTRSSKAADDGDEPPF